MVKVDEQKRVKQALRERALAMGFNLVGVVSARPGRRLAAYEKWIEHGHHGEMGYLSRSDRLSRRRDLNVVLPGVKSIVSVGLDYATRILPEQIAGDPARGRIANYAWGGDYHEIMTPRLKELAAWLGSITGDDVISKVYVDTGAIMERDHAESAGLGFTGKNTMLIHPRRGSWFFLGELMTTLTLPPDLPEPMPTCGRCRRCLDACPTSAFPQPYVLDARRCISYLTIELKGWIPQELRPLMGNWVYGCDICQDVCPFNRFAPASRESAFWPGDWGFAAPALADLLALTDETFAERFRHSPIRRIKRHRLVRNACVAAGNWGERAAIASLQPLLVDPEPLVRGHAAWALGQIGSIQSAQLLAAALASEDDSLVAGEIAGALTTIGNGRRLPD